MATCNGRIDVGRYAIEIKFVHIDRLADAIINQTLYCLSWYNNRLSTAVYNFMQTQKERKPCKIKASAIFFNNPQGVHPLNQLKISLIFIVVISPSLEGRL